MKLCVGSWSLRDHVGSSFPLTDFALVVKKRFGVDAVELSQLHFVDYSLGVGIPTCETAFLNAIRKGIDRAGSVVVNLPIDAGHVSQTDPEGRSFDLALVRQWIDVAHVVGSKAVRVNTESILGRERLQEMPSSLTAAIDSFGQLAEYAWGLGLHLLLENHGGLSADPTAIVELARAVDNPAFGVCADFGNFSAEVRYQALEQVAPLSWMLHAKTYGFTAEGEESSYDFARCLEIFRAQGFDGYISVEYEGDGDQYRGVQQTLDLIRRHW